MDIQNTIDKLLPSKQKVYLEILTEAIKYADSYGSEKWGLSISSDGIKLKVGNIIITTIHPDSIWMALDKKMLEKNSGDLDELLGSGLDDGRWAEYKAVETKNYYYTDSTDSTWQKIKHLHFGAIEACCNKYLQLKRSSQEKNSYELLNYLRKHIDADIPNPVYGSSSEPPTIKFKPTGYWILFCNPKLWQIDEFLETGEVVTTWKITEWQKDSFQKGQLGIIRTGVDGRTKKQLGSKERLDAGIYAIVEITSGAELMHDANDAFWLEPDKHNEESYRVKIRIIKNLLINPILLSEIKIVESLQDEKPLLYGRQASSWALSKHAFDLIESFSDQQNKILTQLNHQEINDLSDLRNLELKYSNQTPRAKEVLSKRIERGAISNAIKKKNNYECQVCKVLGLDPFGFKKSDGIYYIETHHIIPVSELEQGSLGTLNLITVCPNHHRQMHYGNVKIISNNEKYFEFSIDGEKVKIDKNKIEI